MPLYYYVKKEPLSPPTSVVPPKRKVIFSFRLLPTFTSVVGMALIVSVLWPIFSYELISASPNDEVVRTAAGLLNPLVEEVSPAYALGPRVVGNLDYTKASNWFTNVPPVNSDQQTASQTYTVSIPKLRIDEANVIYGSDDLLRSLVHYAGTAMPGQLGSPVIIGHSILPQFYNPKNYISIFSLLPTLEKGDAIIINYDGVTYTYRVESKQEVYPDNVSVLEQRYDSKLLKLITCVPPGLKTRRLVITARLTS
ncbi:MAG: Sortase family protein, LPXTG-site transpeptidase [Candidatus Gottesmanbacteria bacterium GW2011_GWA1_47_8]|uniref:Sortase family protein, LPXTG-site transpeptidase n=1 Tax=Candidatus Gottesmanbacteria bacterium GW2011_GWA1_47_8 TaxID=1618438 RepID=A0A0G1TFU7_9BACT|nr:MAG: Sortase family protein, LPXTG-site transpeptidase [Candidatus Gottesmanbacteria bacterium GW2011_GWA1_47_8]